VRFILGVNKEAAASLFGERCEMSKGEALRITGSKNVFDRNKCLNYNGFLFSSSFFMEKS